MIEEIGLWSNVTNFKRVRDSAVNSHLTKTASKSVHPIGWNLFYKNTAGQTDRHKHTETNFNENITLHDFVEV